MASTSKENSPILRQKLGSRSIVLIGMMGAGKTTVGRRLAKKLELPFVDADAEVEKAAGMPIADIFKLYGEKAFRDGEMRVLLRLLDAGPQILATGGGAYLNKATRSRIKQKGVSVWLKADINVLLRRIKRKAHRPLLLADDPEAVMRKLAEERAATYALADITVESNENIHDSVVDAVISKLAAHLSA